MLLTSVMIGCPVRNRAWILPYYLEAMEKLDYPQELIEYGFIINNSVDDTEKILQDFSLRHPGQVKIHVHNFATPSRHQRGYYNLSNLAVLRNIFIDLFLASSSKYLFSVDSDIIVPSHSLRYLLDDERDVTAALVCNGHQIGDRGIFNILNQNNKGSYVHIRDFPVDQIFPVDCTGAAYLIKRTVLAGTGIRYTAERGSEDIAFCEQVREHGLEIACDPRVICEHFMEENMKFS